MTTLTIPSILQPPTIPYAGGSPLTPSHLAELELSQRRSKKIRRATIVAYIDAALSALFAVTTLLSCLLSPSCLPLAIALSLLTLNSFRGAAKLRRLNPAAPRILALNQLAFAAVIIAYALYSLYQAATTPSELTASLASAGPELTKYNFDQLEWYINLALYSALILGSMIMQGSAALYYATRGKYLLAYLRDTPAWILQIQKTQAGV